MRSCLLIFFTFLLQNVSGQVFVNHSSQLFSKESIESADESLKAVDNPYRVIYIPVLHQLEPAQRLINDSTTLSQLLDLNVASGISQILNKALKEQQAIDLATAETYFSKLKDTAHTILILDNIVETVTGLGGIAQTTHAQGRQFIYGASVPTSFKTIISGYSPLSQLDFNGPATTANDKYLNEYISFVTSTVNGNGAGSISAEVYPQAFPILLLRQPAADTEYVYLDPAVEFTAEEQGQLKAAILTNGGGFYKGLLFQQITPTITKEDLASYEVIMVYAFRMKKGDSLMLGQLERVRREWSLNGNIVPDSITPPTQKQYSLDVFKDMLTDGENTLQVTSDVGTFKNGIKSTFNVHFVYNSNNLFIKAVINGKTTINYPFVSPIVVAADTSGKLLKEKDKVLVAIYQNVDGVETKKEGILWGTYTGDLKAAKDYMRIIQNGKNEISFQAAPNGNLMTIRFAAPGDIISNESYLFDNINVSALKAVEDQQQTKRMFDSALKVIRYGSSVINKKDVALADYFCENNGLIQSYAFPGSDAAFKMPSSDILNGVTNCNPDITVAHYKWLDIKIYQKRGLLEDKNVKLIAYLNATDRQTLQNANIADTGYVKADKEVILNRIGKGRPEIKKTLDSLISIKQLNDKVLDSCYEFIQDDPVVLSWYIDMSNTKKTIKLNYDALSGSQELFTAITAHEMMHIYYPVNNVLSTLKWMVIREKEKAYGLKLGTGDCSKGPGHEKYNPECEKVCDKQKDFTPQNNSTSPSQTIK